MKNLIIVSAATNLKRFTAILFLAVLWFNMAGYQLVIGYLQELNDSRLVAQLDREEYSNDELLSIKTPLTLPYYNNSEHYERVDGTINIEGVEYKYVKRRIFNDSLELLCVPNKGKEQLQTAKVDFFKLSHDWQASKDGKKSSGTIKNVLPEFCEELITFSVQHFIESQTTYALLTAPHLPSLFSRVHEQPPDATPFI